MAKRRSSKRISDAYVNRAYVEVVMSAANTLTFSQIRWAVGLFQGIAIKINRIEWFPNGATLREVVTAADILIMAITSRNDLANLDVTNQSIYCGLSVVGVGVNVEPRILPFQTDFSTLSEGGLLVPANPMYIAANSVGFAVPGEIRALIYYQFVELSDQEALEVLQTVIPGNV